MTPSHQEQREVATLSTWNTEDIENVLKRVEISMHRGGWDQAPNVGVIIDAEVPGTRSHFQHGRAALRYSYSTPVVRVGRYMSLPLLPDEGLQPNMAVALHRLAINVSAGYDRPETQQMLDMMRHPGLVAILAAYEAWMNDDVEVCERARRERLRLADIPGSVEVRHVYAVNMSLDAWTVFRVRGKAPELLRVSDAAVDEKNEVTFSGALPQDMRALVSAILGNPVRELSYTPSLWDHDQEMANAKDRQ